LKQFPLLTFTWTSTQKEQLSKDALSLREGVLIEQEFREGALVSESEKSLFFIFQEDDEIPV
jgi:hypothetical protein